MERLYKLGKLEGTMGQAKKLKPFGEIPESFKGLKDEWVYYVDKTGFIPYLISQENMCRNPSSPFWQNPDASHLGDFF